MKSASDIVLKLLGILLLTAAILKGWQLLTEPMANTDIWNNRAFLIFTVEFEIALGIWLLSGVFKKLAWLVTLACFSMFAIITLYKGISGAESCGCFGSVHVNPWITLFAIDLPAVIAMAVFRPVFENRTATSCCCHSYNCRCGKTGLVHKAKTLIQKTVMPLPSMHRLIGATCFSLAILAVTGCVLAFNEPAKVANGYEVLEPETWIGKGLPILKYIDISKQIKTSTWLVLFYHYDCPDCVTAISQYQRNAVELVNNEDLLKIAFIEIPPYGRSIVRNSPDYAVGKLLDIKEWFITTPAIVLLEGSTVQAAWEGKVLDLDAVLRNVATLSKMNLISRRPRKEVMLARSKIEFKNKLIVRKK